MDDERRINARHIRDYVQRPFQRLSFDVSGVVEPKRFMRACSMSSPRGAQVDPATSDEPAPIIEISLRGHLGFKNSLLDLRRLRDEAQTLTGALHVMMRNQSVPIEYAVAAGLDADTTRAQREQRIVEDLIARDTRYRERAREMAELVLEAKRRALGDDSPADILGLIEQKLDTSARNAAHDAGEAAAAAPSPGALQALERSAEKAVNSELSVVGND